MHRINCETVSKFIEKYSHICMSQNLPFTYIIMEAEEINIKVSNFMYLTCTNKSREFKLSYQMSPSILLLITYHIPVCIVGKVTEI